MGNVLIPDLPSLALSASTNTSKENIHTNVLIAGPRCTKSNQDWQSHTSSRSVALLQMPATPPPKQKPPSPLFPSPTSIPPLLSKAVFPPRSPTRMYKRICPSYLPLP